LKGQDFVKSKAKRLLSTVLSVLLAAICALGIFISNGFSAVNKQLPVSVIAIDQKSGTVKNAAQKITGKIDSIGEKVNITYKIYSGIDKGQLSFEGKASIKGNTFSLNNLKLKPNANKIIITATSAAGKTDVKTVDIKYDCSSIKKPALRNVAEVTNGRNLMYINNNLLVYFKENVSDARRQAIIDTVGGKCVGYINGINMWQVEVKATDFNNLIEMAAKLSAMDGVFYASYNRAHAAQPMATQVIPNDPWYSNSGWTELNPNGGNWSVEAVQALSAWGYESYYSHINVGIVDAGLQNDHEDLTGKIFFPDAASAAENTPTDDHGTFVAGIMGAIPNNNKGVTGILWDTNMYCVNWDVAGGTDANLFAGLTETVQAGAKVVNFSLGLSADISGEGLPSVNPDVISYARQSEAVMTPLLNAGYDFIVVQSAGNGHNGYSQDAIYNGYFCSVTYTNLQGSAAMVQKINERIIIVGAAERTGPLTFDQVYYSDAGTQVDICAPGVSVYGCFAGNAYGYMSGTSMAAPMVASIAALAWSVNPALTGSQVRSILLNNTSYTVADNTSIFHPLVSTYNMVNAKLAVEAAIATHAPDYSAVNTAVTAANALNSALYTTDSWAALTAAVSAVDYNLLYIDQPQINTMAQNINTAIAGLVLKTVSYTVEYRLNSETGSKLAADKTSSGQVTNTVSETAIAINGYIPLAAAKNLQLSLDNNKIVFVYIARPLISAVINTYKTVNGSLTPITSARAGDIITVTVTPATNFFCGSSRYIVMYDKNFYTIVGSSNTAFTANTENTYYQNTVTSFSGVTTQPLTWPATFVSGENTIYNYTVTLFNAGSGSLNGGYPTVINDGKWLFSFKLQVNAGATGSGRIFMDNRWTRNASYPTGSQYFYWCADGTTLSAAGSSTMDFNADFSLADRTVSLDTSKIVTFDLNGGTGTAPAAQSGATGTAVTLPAQTGFNRQNYNFLGWAASQTATSPLASYTIPAADATLYAVWSKMPVTLNAKSGSNTVINNNFIYGLASGITAAGFSTNYVTVNGNGRLAFTPDTGVIGTGTKVDLIDNTTQAIAATYYIVIYGDVNGDGNIDSIDAGIMVDLENYIITWDKVADAAKFKAGDVNGDGNIDSLDAGIAVDSENYIMHINQATGIASLIS